MLKANNTLVLLTLLFISVSSLISCNTTKHEGLPILSQDDLIRPYSKLGRIKVTRETFLSDYAPSPDITSWGQMAVRTEAEKMGADAVMLMEITGRSTTFGIIPSSEYQATGFAIKFK